MVFKYIDGKLDTGSYTGSYQYKPLARMYNKPGTAKAMWNRFIKAGYGSRVGEIVWDEETDSFTVQMISDDWVPTTQRCKHGKYRQECQRRVGHSGIHWSGIEAKRDPDFDPEA